jgi:hypothetical protein
VDAAPAGTATLAFAVCLLIGISSKISLLVAPRSLARAFQVFYFPKAFAKIGRLSFPAKSFHDYF